MMNLRSALLVGTHLAAAFLGWKLRDADYQRHLKREAKAQVVAQQETRKVEARNEDLSQAHREQNSRDQQQVQIVYRTVTREVPKYVTLTKFESQVVAAGGLPAGFVWTYNQSASNSTAPLPPSLDPDTPSGTDMSALASVTAGNFAVCHAYRAELQQWHEWYNDLSDTWPSSLVKPAKPSKQKEHQDHDQ